MPGKYGCTHTPEKSGVDAAIWGGLLFAGNAGRTACPEAGVAATIANVTNDKKSRRCAFMSLPRSQFARAHSSAATVYPDVDTSALMAQLHMPGQVGAGVGREGGVTERQLYPDSVQ
jgi:hypothetical protein